MSIDKFLAAIFSVAGIIFTYWFFLMKKEDAIVVSDSVDIVVEGGVEVDNKKIINPEQIMPVKNMEILIKVGKRRFAKIKLD
jgi:hypothetical protein